MKATTPSGAADLPEALRLADELCEAIAEYPEPTALEAQAAAELRRQHIRITELEAQLAQRFDAADMATAAAQGFRDGVTSAPHGQAPAGTTEPTEQQILEAAEKAGLWPNTVHSWIPAFHRYHKELAKARPAPAPAAPAAVAAPADSELEDAARYRLLRRGQHWSVIDGIGNDLRAEVLDAAVDAARKQGENHGR